MKRGGGLARALLVALLALSPWGFDDAASSSRGDAASSDGREAAGLIRFRPRTSSSSSSSSSSSTLFALAAHDDVYSGGIITVDSRGNPVGDTVSAPARSMVGFVQDCVGIPPKNSGSLCGARGSYLHGHYLFVAATLQNAVTCVDVYRPDMPTIAGSVADRVNLEQVVATWMHRSEDYLVAVSRGKRPAGIGSVTLVDVRPARWSVDSSDRPIVSPVVLTSLKNCSSTTTVDGVRTTTGSLCGARAENALSFGFQFFNCFFPLIVRVRGSAPPSLASDRFQTRRLTDGTRRSFIRSFHSFVRQARARSR
jgi:hypothetical protein